MQGKGGRWGEGRNTATKRADPGILPGCKYYGKNKVWKPCLSIKLPAQAVTAGCNCLESRETGVCASSRQMVPWDISCLGMLLPPCSLTQSLVLSAAKVPPSANLDFILYFFYFLYMQMWVVPYWKQIVNYQTIKSSICLLDWLSNSPINYNSTNY